MLDTDVFVIGGGPAGLAAAIAARMSGLRVIVAEAQSPPVDKACGEGLMPDALAAAASLGVPISPDLGFPFRGIRFWGGDRTVAGDFPNATGLGVRRPVLHRVLVEHAQNIGIEILWKCPVLGMDRDTVRLLNESVKTRWIVGADGTQSSVRRWAGMQTFRRDSKRFSYRRHYQIPPWSDFMEIHWGDGCQFYVTPVSANEVCLVLMTRNSGRRIADALPLFPRLASRLSGCEETTSERGALAATRKIRNVTRGNVALIGDASGTIDPITGEGLCLALKQSVALAHAFQQQDLNLYERAHSQMTRRPRFMADFMLLLDRSSLLQRRTLAAFEAHPQLFSNLLAMHVGELNHAKFLATAAVLGWQVVTT